MKALLLLLIALSVAIPSHFVAAALPVIWALQPLLPTDVAILAQVGPVALTLSDLVILLLAVRLTVSIFWQKELVVDRPLYLALAAYLIVNLVATLIAGIKFGEAHLIRSATSLARFGSELLILPILAQAVRTMPQARMCVRVLLGTLAALAVIQFVNYFGAGHGLVIGEVQGMERGAGRYFGPVGDSIGVVLLLGYLASLCFANLAAAALFLGGILLTAGIGAIFAASVGTGFFLLFGLRTLAVREFARRSLWLLPVIALSVVIAGALFARPLTGTLLDRLGTGAYSSSGSQRTASAKLAVEMIGENPMLGVGYLGYERALAHYGGERYFDLETPNGATANANNQLLQSLTDSGVLGLLAVGAFIFCAARLFLRLTAETEDRFLGTFFLAAFLWLLSQVFGNLAAVWLNPSSFVARLLWVSLGIAVAVARSRSVPGPQLAKSEHTPDEARLVAA